ncbi:CCC motif membrane protein [Flavobacterium sp. U410]
MENQKLPNATGVLILGIVSLFGCCCYGILGIILGIIALILAAKDTRLYNENPELYSNYNNLKVGKILAIIGLIISIIWLLIIVWIVVNFGFEVLKDDQLLQYKLNEYFGLQ